MMFGAAAEKSLNESGCVQHRETEIDFYEIFDDMIYDIPYGIDLCFIYSLKNSYLKWWTHIRH